MTASEITQCLQCGRQRAAQLKACPFCGALGHATPPAALRTDPLFTAQPSDPQSPSALPPPAAPAGAALGPRGSVQLFGQGGLQPLANDHPALQTSDYPSLHHAGSAAPLRTGEYGARSSGPPSPMRTGEYGARSSGPPPPMRTGEYGAHSPISPASPNLAPSSAPPPPAPPAQRTQELWAAQLGGSPSRGAHAVAQVEALQDRAAPKSLDLHTSPPSDPATKRPPPPRILGRPPEDLRPQRYRRWVWALLALAVLAGGLTIARLIPKRFPMHTVAGAPQTTLCEGHTHCVVAFLAPWDPASDRSIATLQHLKRLFDADDNRLGLAVVIAQDDPAEQALFAERLPVPYWFEQGDALSAAFKLKQTPQWWLLDVRGRITRSVEGTYQPLEAHLNALGIRIDAPPP